MIVFYRNKNIKKYDYVNFHCSKDLHHLIGDVPLHIICRKKLALNLLCQCCIYFAKQTSSKFVVSKLHILCTTNVMQTCCWETSRFATSLLQVYNLQLQVGGKLSLLIHQSCCKLEASRICYTLFYSYFQYLPTNPNV